MFHKIGRSQRSGNKYSELGGWLSQLSSRLLVDGQLSCFTSTKEASRSVEEDCGSFHKTDRWYQTNSSQIMSIELAHRLCLVVSHLEFVDWLVSPVSQQCQCQASQRILGTNTLEEGRSVIFCDKESSQLVQSRKETERGFVTSGNPGREPESVTRMSRCVNTWLTPPWLSINFVKEAKLVTRSDISLSVCALSTMKEINPARFCWVVWENIEAWLEEQLLDSVWWGQSGPLQWDGQLLWDYQPMEIDERGNEKWKGKFLGWFVIDKSLMFSLTHCGHSCADEDNVGFSGLGSNTHWPPRIMSPWLFKRPTLERSDWHFDQPFWRFAS